MNLVADEGIDKQVVDSLRASGFTVLYFAEYSPGSSDAEILSRAGESSTLLLTADKDFGELVFRQGLTTTGVILIRLHGFSPESKGEIVRRALLNHGSSMAGTFSVISPGLLRIRRVP